MRRAAALVAGIALAAIMSASLPWNLEQCADVCGMSSSSFGGVQALGLVLYLTIPAAVLTAILVSILGVRAADSHEAAVRAALGEAAHAGTMRAARRGLIDGLAVGALVYVLAGATHVALEVTRGWEAFQTSTDTWGTRAVEAFLVTLCLTLAHVIAVTRPRRTPVERLREDVESARPVRVGRRAAIIGGIGIAAAGVLVALAVSIEVAVDLSTRFYATNTAGIAWGVVGISCALFGLAVVLPWARSLAPRAVAAAGGLAEATGAPRLAAVLAARASSPTKASGRTVMAVGGIAFALTALLTAPVGVSAGDNKVMTLTVEDGADAELEARLATIPGVERVVVAGSVSSLDPWMTLIAVDPADLHGVAPEIADALESHPGAAVSGATDVLWLSTPSFTPTGIVPLAEASDTYVALSDIEADVNATTYLVYAEDGADWAAIQEAANWAHSTASASSWSSSNGSGDSWAGVLTFATLLGLALTPVAIGVVRAGAQGAATLSALGASSRLVRGALVIEGAAMACVAVAAGAVAGVLTHMTMQVMGALRHSLTGVITDSWATLALESVPWGYALLWSALIIGLFTAVTALTATAWHLDTPAEALRDGAVR